MLSHDIRFEPLIPRGLRDSDWRDDSPGIFRAGSDLLIASTWLRLSTEHLATDSTWWPCGA